MQITSAEAMHADAHEAMERSKKLRETGSQTIATLLHAERDFKTTQLSIEAARIRLEGNKIELDAAKKGLFVGDSYNDLPRSAQRARRGAPADPRRARRARREQGARSPTCRRARGRKRAVLATHSHATSAPRPRPHLGGADRQRRGGARRARPAARARLRRRRRHRDGQRKRLQQAVDRPAGAFPPARRAAGIPRHASSASPALPLPAPTSPSSRRR